MVVPPIGLRPLPPEGEASCFRCHQAAALSPPPLGTRLLFSSQSPPSRPSLWGKVPRPAPFRSPPAQACSRQRKRVGRIRIRQRIRPTSFFQAVDKVSTVPKKFPFWHGWNVKGELPSPLHNPPMRVYALPHMFVYSLILLLLFFPPGCPGPSPTRQALWGERRVFEGNSLTASASASCSASRRCA